jgi:hypothetical protein
MTLLYEPADGDPHKVLSPCFPFCYPPTVHRFADWVPVDGWREGPAPGWRIDQEGPNVPLRQALVLIWRGEVLSDAYHRLHDVLSKIEKQSWTTVDGWNIRYPDMTTLYSSGPERFLSSMCVRETAPTWLSPAFAPAWYLARGAVKCLRGNTIEWDNGS